MNAETLLSRLDRVRQSGRDRWTARCPAHDDRGPSLSIRELDDGRTLIHCFAGCSTGDVLGAVGLDFDVLFPERRIGDRMPRERRPYLLRELVAALRHELVIAWVILAAVHQGRPLGEHDRRRAGVAVDRVLQFLGELNHAA